VRARLSYVFGEWIRIKSGPFQGFTGRIEEVDNDKATLRIRVRIFGRMEPIELGFTDVEKIKLTEEE
jgi:transcription termination/antitermination protein NusG